MSLRLSLLFLFVMSLLPLETVAQSVERRTLVAVLDFANSNLGRVAAEKVAANLRGYSELNLLDRDQARTAARGAGYGGSLNMSLEEARIFGATIGCDYYLIGDVQTLRRSPSNTPVYFESYASIFLVSSRTGRLLMWLRPSFTAATSESAEKLLLADLSSAAIGRTIRAAIRRTQEDERVAREAVIESSTPLLEAPDDEKIAEQQGLRLPRPYRRLQPTYPESAARAEAEATVDVLLDLDNQGEVIHAAVVRWAGFGLDEATLESVRRLHFFPAMRNGSPIPIRVLLRYNFRKPPK
jgi:TonB family protein